MATTTPNYGWPVPTSTDFVKDGATAIEALGDAIDATVFGLPTGALTLISTTTIGTAVSSVTVTSAFSATYDNYKIILTGGTSSAAGNIGLTFGASATGYYAAGTFILYSAGGVSAIIDNNATSFTRAGRGGSNPLLNLNVFSPFLAKETFYSGDYITSATASGSGFNSGYHDSAVSYTDFTLTPVAGMTLTGGTIRVYGYEN